MNNKNPGVKQLLGMYRVEMAEFFRLAQKYRNYNNKATKKNHIHIHREPGSKLLKKHDRPQWNLKNGFTNRI